MADSDFWTACFTVGPLFEVAFATMAQPARRYLLKKDAWATKPGAAATPAPVQPACTNAARSAASELGVLVALGVGVALRARPAKSQNRV